MNPFTANICLTARWGNGFSSRFIELWQEMSDSLLAHLLANVKGFEFKSKMDMKPCRAQA